MYDEQFIKKTSYSCASWHIYTMYWHMPYHTGFLVCLEEKDFRGKSEIINIYLEENETRGFWRHNLPVNKKLEENFTGVYILISYYYLF